METKNKTDEKIYHAERYEGRFNTIEDLKFLCKIICNTTDNYHYRCFLAIIRGKNYFIYTHSDRTVATHSNDEEWPNIIEVESDFKNWPEYIQIFFLLHEIGHIELGHIDFICNHKILHSLDVFKACYIDSGNEKIEIEADLFAKRVMSLSDQKYKKCIKSIEDQYKERYTNKEIDKKDFTFAKRMLAGRMKKVLSLS